MPITITVSSEPTIGPGSRFTLTTDLIGPIPSDWIWSLIVEQDPEGAVWVTQRPALSAFTVGGNLGVQDEDWLMSNQDLVFPAEGDAVFVSATLRTALGVVQDEGDRSDLTWTTQGNFVREVLTEAQSDGALTTEQAAQLAAIGPAVTLGFATDIGGVLTRGVSDLLVHPPVGLLHVDGTPEVLTGRGALTRPLGPFSVAAFGATMTFFTVPAGFGFRDGAVVEYHQRIVQLATTHTLLDDLDERVTEVLDLHLDGFAWLWSMALPTRILYDVTPGCVVILRWLSL